MKKKKSGGGGANWMDTYGDMVTLLLCFFVLLYSMSSITEDKWKAIVLSFNPNAVQTPTDPNGNSGPFADPDVGDQNPGLNEIESAQKEIDSMIEELFEEITSMLQTTGLSDSVSATLDGGKIYLNFTDTTFFGPNSPELLKDAYPILDEMSALFQSSAAAIDEIRVQGHTAQGTPGRPNNTRTDRELSAGRANNVVIYIQDHTDWQVLDPAKLRSEGLGQWFPIGDNGTPEGRAQNRRVEIIISGRNLEEEARLNEKLDSYDTPSYTT